MDSDNADEQSTDVAPDRLRHTGALVASLGVLLWVWFASDGADLITSLVGGRWLSFPARYIAIHQSLDPETRNAIFYVEHGLPVLFRLAASLVVIGIVLGARAKQWVGTFRKFFAETADARGLAVMRIALFGAMGWWWLNNDMGAFVALPRELIVPPPGLGWIADLLPTDMVVVGAISVMFVFATFLAMLGFFTRWSAWMATLLGLIVLGIPQFYGKIDHYHHFVWFGALLAASPSGDAWSVDAWRKGNPAGPGSAQRYAYPMRIIILLIGCFYFFAGFWKIVIGGAAWTDETMRTILHAQWMRIDWLPPLRVDTWGIWTAIGGTSVIAFEVFFILAILHPRTRRWAAVAGVVFHLAVLLTTGINFWTLLVCYAVFLDTIPLRSGTSADRRIHEEKNPPTRGTRRLGMALVVTAVMSGFLLIDSWPVAVYPTFAGMAEPRAWTVTIEGMRADGEYVLVRPWNSAAMRTRFGNSRVGGLVSQVTWEQEPRRREQKALALARVTSAVEPGLKGVTSMAIYRDLVDVDPQHWGDAPIRRERLAVWRATGG